MFMLKINRLKSVDVVVLVVMLLIAGLARFEGLRIVPFQYDEAIIADGALGVAQGHSLPLVGNPSSVGVRTGPVSLYLMALPFALSTNPLVASALIAGLNTLGVGLLWFMTQRYFSRPAAWIAGLVYALNPWALIYGSRIWEPNMYPPFLLLAIFLGLYGFAEPDTGKTHRWARILCLPVFLIAVQTHLAGWLLLPLYPILLWMGGRKTLKRGEMMLSIGLGLLAVLPYLIGQIQLYQSAPEIFHFSPSGKSITFSDQAVQMLVQLATGLGYEAYALLPAFAPTFLVPVTLWPIIGILAVVGLASLFRRPLSRLAALPIAWIAIPILLFSFTWTDVHIHYFTGILPALSLLTGLGTAWLYELCRSYLQGKAQWLVLGAASLLALTFGLAWARFVTVVDTQPTGGDFNLPVHYLLDIKAELASFKNVVIVGNDYWDQYAKEPKVWDVLLNDTADCVRATGSHGFIVIPPGPFAALITPLAAADPVENVYSSATSSTVTLRPGDKPYQVNVFDRLPDTLEAGLTAVGPVAFGNGAQLTGYRWEQDKLTLEWLVTRSDVVDYQYFVHILDGQGNRIAQRDTRFLPGLSWCAGDHVLTTTPLKLPDGAATLRVGMYQLGLGGGTQGMEQINVIDSDGNAVSPWQDIPLPQASTP